MGWKTTDGSNWWLRDGRYNEPNGDYHANCYLHIYDVNPNNVRFNDGNCNYCSTEYMCQKISKTAKTKTVVAYQTGDTRSGCPRKQGANTPLITRKVTVKEDSYVVATGHMIRRYSGRADLHLRLNNKIIDYSLTYTPNTQWKDTQVYWVGSIKKGTQTFTITGKSNLDYSLTYTNSKRWEDVKLHWTGRLNKGTHTFSIRSNRANAFGCGSSWGDIDILVLPEKMG